MTTLLQEKIKRSLKEGLTEKDLPEHIAIIMDGNRRWALQKGLPTHIGHWKGAESIDRVVEASKELGIKMITLFAFSTENWGRSKQEIKMLFHLFSTYLRRKKNYLIKEGIKVETIGDLTKLPIDLQNQLQQVKEQTAHGCSIEVVFALNYGAKDEIVRAVNRLFDDMQKNKIERQEVTEKLLSSYLDTNKWKDPDFLIRTSGESRLSNFLLWQLSYAEVYVTDVLWPEFGYKELFQAIKEYQRRTRRFGE